MNPYHIWLDLEKYSCYVEQVSNLQNIHTKSDEYHTWLLRFL